MNTPLVISMYELGHIWQVVPVVFPLIPFVALQLEMDHLQKQRVNGSEAHQLNQSVRTMNNTFY